MSTDFTGNPNPAPALGGFVQQVVGGTQRSEITTSSVIKAGGGFCYGVFVASSSSGTLKLYDNPTAGSGTVVINTFTPNLGWNPINMPFFNGLYATAGGTIDCTFSFT